MIERKSIVDQSELTRTNGVQVRIALLLVEDEKEIGSTWLRTAIPLEADPQQQMDSVNEYLATMDPPFPAISQADIEFINQCHALLSGR